MSLSFPPSPSVNDTYTNGLRTWTWTGAVWELTGTTATGLVTNDLLADDAVTTTKIATGAVTDTKIASNAVTTAKIANSAVTASKVASGVAVSNLGFTPASTGKSIAMSIVFGG